MDFKTKKSVIELRLEGKSFTEIARILNITRSAAHSVTQSFMLEWEMFFDLIDRLDKVEESQTESRKLIIFLLQDWLRMFIKIHDINKSYSLDYFSSKIQILNSLADNLKGCKGLNEIFKPSLNNLIRAVQKDAVRAEYNAFSGATPSNIAKVTIDFDWGGK